MRDYVNSLVEQDGVKVLLVANEQEIYKYEEIEQLKQGLEELLKQGAFEDKIKANQIKWFISNLENFILKLNK